ncbi:hypothetical protein BH23PSE1_BH23PSE1_00390 [soil metagenome]
MTVDILRDTSHDSLSLAELDLYHAIMDYRAAIGLPAIPLSSALTATAGRHVLDTRENIWAAEFELPRGANLHSWSDAPYYADHSNPDAMWYAPSRLGTGYEAPAYEITAAGFPEPADALAGWIASPSHLAIIANTGPWAGQDWQAIGVGFEASSGAGPYAGRIAHIWFGAAADTAGPPEIRGSAGADIIIGPNFDDVILGFDGDDVIHGGGGNDRLFGGAGNDTLHGGPGNDILRGGPGNDRLFGGPGNDRLFGGPDDDLLVGGNGVDVLTGGPGADIFRFRTIEEAGIGERRDVITDFEPGIDTIDLVQIDANASRPDHVHSFRFIGGDDFSGRPRELRYDGANVAGDVTGNGEADFEIGIQNGAALTASDFLF